MFPLVKIYSDPNSDSCFENIDIPPADAGKIDRRSVMLPAIGIIFREITPGYDYELHNAPLKQFRVIPDGIIEIETSLGIKRQFTSGDVLLLTDTTGKGHRTKNTALAPGKLIFIPIT